MGRILVDPRAVSSLRRGLVFLSLVAVSVPAACGRTTPEKVMSIEQPDGYLATPSSGRGKPVLVLHPWWGLNETIKGVCRRLADEGYVAFAPDLYHGEIATGIPDAERLSSALFKKADSARADVARAADYVIERADGGGDSLAVIGFSMGAFYALDLSVSDPERVRKVVVFYGTGPGDFTAARAAYLGHFAAADEYEPKEGVDALEAALRKAGRPHTLHVYPGTGHWFFEPDRTDAYDAQAAKLAWDRTIAFLKEDR